MNITILDSKNGEKTVKINDIYIHSSYNPTSEAKKFCQTLDFNINPAVIFVIEPGLSYLYSNLKEKFPNSKIGIIRFTKEFEKYNKDWDFSLNYFDLGFNTNPKNGRVKALSKACLDRTYSFTDKFEHSITQYFSESELCSSVFVNWNPTIKIFEDLNNSLWKKIKLIIENSRTILITRQYFEKKWLVNTCNSLKYANTYKLEKINPNNKDVLIVASGPSLGKVINKIKENRKNLFIICLSSAISALKFFKIEPDLYLSTDGGFWAGEHLKKIRFNQNIPLILPIESYCKKQILQKNQIVLGCYRDGISKEILDFENFHFLTLERNGTISGTALEFAKKITTNNIFFAGLDLQGSKGFQHILPNEIETNNSIKTNKIKTTETFQSASRYNTKSLSIYRDWFINYKNTNNTYRIIEDENNMPLGQIQDISTLDFSKKINKSTKNESYKIVKNNVQINNQELINFIKENITKEKWQTTLFPLDYVAKNNAKSEEQIDFFENKIKERTRKLLNKIQEILNE